MTKSPSPRGAKLNLSPLNAFVLYCLATPQDRRDAMRELLGDAEASRLFEDIPVRESRNGSAATARSRPG